MRRMIASLLQGIGKTALDDVVGRAWFNVEALPSCFIPLQLALFHLRRDERQPAIAILVGRRAVEESDV